MTRENLLDPRYHETSEHDLFRGALRDPHKKREYERQRAFGGDADAVDRDFARDEQQRENKRHHDNTEYDASAVELAEVLVCQTDAGGALCTESVSDNYENISDRHECQESRIVHEDGKYRHGLLDDRGQTRYIRKSRDEVGVGGVSHVSDSDGDHREQLENRQHHERVDDDVGKTCNRVCNLFELRGLAHHFFFGRRARKHGKLLAHEKARADLNETECDECGDDRADDRSQNMRLAVNAVSESVEVAVDGDEVIEFGYFIIAVDACYRDRDEYEEYRQECRLSSSYRVVHDGDHDRQRSDKKCETYSE